MNETQMTELQQALATVRRCAEDLPIGRRYKVVNLCGRIAQEARKKQPEPPSVSARYARLGAPDENPNETSAPTQRKAILALLESGTILTKENAKRLTGAEDYRKRISELRRQGHPIEDRWCSGLNRYGHHCTYKEYFITKPAEA